MQVGLTKENQEKVEEYIVETKKSVSGYDASVTSVVNWIVKSEIEKMIECSKRIPKSKNK